METTQSSAPVREPKSNGLTIGGVWLLVMAALLLLCGLCSTFFYIVLPLTSKTAASSQLQNNVVFGSAAGFGLLMGAILVWQGISTLRGRVSVRAARMFPPFFVFVLAFIGAILLGAAALLNKPIAVYAFPPWHFLAASLPPLALLAYAAHVLGRASGFRALVVSFSWGALGATLLAAVLEIAIGLVVVIVIAVYIVSLPNSQALLAQLQQQVQLAERGGNLTTAQSLLTNPWVTTALLVYFAVIIPPLEEAVKALVVAFIDPRRTTRADALLWGIAAGAGFAVLENMFNGSAELTAWVPLILLRVGAAIVHVANGANMGRGWYAARVEGNWSKLLFAYAGSVVFHAAWNAGAILTSNTGTNAGSGGGAQPIFTLVTLALLLFLVLLALSGFAWIIYSVRSARKSALQIS